MIQLTSRAGNFSCARANEPSCPTLPAAVTPSAAFPALTRKSRRSIHELPLMLVLLSDQRCPACSRPSMRRRQPDPEAPVERIAIQEVCQRNVLRHKAGGMDQNPLVIALPTGLRARHQLVNFAVKLLAREQAGLDHAPELALQQVEFPTVDDDLVHLRPAGR